MPKNIKGLNKEFVTTFYAIKKVSKLNEQQEVMYNLLLSMVKKGDINGYQACYTMGVIVAKGEEGIKEFVAKQKQEIKEEVKNND